MTRFLIVLLVAVAMQVSAGSADSAENVTVRVMTFNLWHGGDAGGQPLTQTVKVIREAKVDIVGLQETHGHAVKNVRPDNGQQIASMLGWHYLQQGHRTGILSRFPIRKHTPRKWGVEIEYSTGKTLHFFNTHFAASPYQPYQLLRIPYGKAPFITTEEEAIHWAGQARGGQVTRLLSELGGAVKSGLPVILTGDFNEPSHQDWTARAKEAARCPVKVEYPATRRITDAGLKDAWRLCHTDEVRDPGHTWTPTTSADDPKDWHDRIDFVFVAGSTVRVTTCKVVGERAESADIVISPWPSDHRAVVASLSIKNPTSGAEPAAGPSRGQ